MGLPVNVFDRLNQRRCLSFAILPDLKYFAIT
jgi:hypothetical protein